MRVEELVRVSQILVQLQSRSRCLHGFVANAGLDLELVLGLFLSLLEMGH